MIKLDRYPKQFLLSLDQYVKIDGWSHEEVCEIKVSRSKYLPLVKIINANKIIGFFLGWFTYNDKFYYRDDIIEIENNLLSIKIENACGRFLLIKKTENDIFIFTDAGSQLPVVYDEKRKNVASSPAIINKFFKTEYDREIMDGVRRFDNSIWYPFGLVPFKNIKRLLPSRSIGLLSGKTTVKRYEFKNNDNLSSKIITESIFNQVTSNIKAMSESGPLKAHLTAGYDSRMVLSSCLMSKKNISWQTIKLDNIASVIDCEAAKKISELLHLNHKIIEFKLPNTKEVNEWLERTGYCIKDAVTTLCKTVKLYEDSEFVLTGSCGEVGRAFYWQKADIKEKQITPELIINRLGFKKSHFLINKCSEWQDKLDINLDRTTTLDIAYIDNRLGCWAGPSAYGHDIEKPTISPFNEYKIYDLMMSLSKEYRLTQQFARDFIKISDDILLSIPFNRAIGLKKIKYIKYELRKLLPVKIKNFIKNKI